MMRILIVEDTFDVGEGIAACVTRLGHAADWVQDGTTADRMLQQTDYDLVILDLMLPELDGVSVLRRHRVRRGEAAVLVLTAVSEINSKVDALDTGADDYLIKPFDFRELEARIRLLLRRRIGKRTNELSFGALSLDLGNQSASLAGAAISFTRRELSLLEILLSSPSRIFTKYELIDQLFGYRAEPNENAIEVMIGRLRRKLGSSGVGIETHRGLGYRIGLCSTAAASAFKRRAAS